MSLSAAAMLDPSAAGLAVIAVAAFFLPSFR